jgi:hypothetical protein
MQLLGTIINNAIACSKWLSLNHRFPKPLISLIDANGRA